MTIAINILVFLVTISILVIIHEYGHFWVARRLGVVVEKFSLGFGKPLLSWRSKHNIEYSVSPILFGGYVKLQDESYGSQPVWRRLLIMAAGVLANLLLAVLIFWVVFVVGLKLPKPVIGRIIPSSIAAQAGLHPGDEITHIDGTRTNSWQRVAVKLLSRVGDKGSLQINEHTLRLENWEINELNPDPMHSLGIVPYSPHIPAAAAKVLPNSPAAIIGFKAHDKVIAVDGHKVADWFALIKYIQSKPEQTMTFTVQRGNKQLQLQGQLGSRRAFFAGRKVGYLGVSSVPAQWDPRMLQEIKLPVGSAFVAAAEQTWYLLSFNYIIIGKLLTGKLSFKVLGGPVTIFVTAGQAFQSGFMTYFLFLALLSIMLAFVNMLPIPALDGGNFLLLLVEGVIRRPLPEKVQFMALKVGMLLLVLIIFVAVGNDLFRLLQ